MFDSITYVCLLCIQYYVVLYNATEDVDYNSGPYNATFPVGSTNASFDVIVYDDRTLESNELFIITIGSITNGRVEDPKSVFIVIIDTTGEIKCYVHVL